MSDRKYTIYAIDFDGTLCESVWPGIGEPNLELIEHLKKRRRQGNRIILWTCRVGDRLNEAVDWCKGYGLEFDAVNENLPEMIEKYGNDSRKIFADVYIDDKAVNKSKYRVLYRARRMRMKREYEHPECFTPEKNNPYPLCVGNGSEKCEKCCLYVDYPEPPFD